MSTSTGRVAQIQGAVVDCEFPVDNLPEIYEAVEVSSEDGESLILEVQKHLGDNLVRCVAMDATEGMRRGLPANATGSPISVPVGEGALGRIFNVLGRAIDDGGEVQASSGRRRATGGCGCASQRHRRRS